MERERCPHADGAVKAATFAGGASGVTPAAGMATALRASGRSWRLSAMEAGRPVPKSNANVMASRSACSSGQVEGDHTGVTVALAQPARRIVAVAEATNKSPGLWPGGA